MFKVLDIGIFSLISSSIKDGIINNINPYYEDHLIFQAKSLTTSTCIFFIILNLRTVQLSNKQSEIEVSRLQNLIVAKWCGGGRNLTPKSILYYSLHRQEMLGQENHEKFIAKVVKSSIRQRK